MPNDFVFLCFPDQWLLKHVAKGIRGMSIWNKGEEEEHLILQHLNMTRFFLFWEFSQGKVPGGKRLFLICWCRDFNLKSRYLRSYVRRWFQKPSYTRHEWSFHLFSNSSSSSKRAGKIWSFVIKNTQKLLAHKILMTTRVLIDIS